MGRTHARAWEQTVAKLSGVVSQSKASAERLASRYGVPVYDSLEAMLPHIDLLDICTPTHLHYGMTLSAAAAGVHVICEKPMARSVAQAAKMIEACKAAGVKLLVAQVVRFFPDYANTHEKIKAGKIGDLASIRLRRSTSRPVGSNGWFQDLDRSGGVILDLMIHDFDFARWIGGEIESVFAKCVSLKNANVDVDHAMVMLTHANGVISHIEGATLEDVKAIATPVLRHRIITTFNAESNSITSDDVVAQLLEKIPERKDDDKVAPELAPAFNAA